MKQKRKPLAAARREEIINGAANEENISNVYSILVISYMQKRETLLTIQKCL